jgi:xylan 1,4-beta-xylosidase
MKVRFIILLFCVSLMQGNSLIGQNTFKNPILTGMNPDPTIVRVGDDFYLSTSTFEYFPGCPVYHSKDLVNWKLIGHALDSETNCPLMGAESGTGGNYAATLRYYNGKFYLACTNYGGEGSQGQFYVTAENPAGPWSNPIWVGNWNVDPSMLFVNDSLYYLTPNNDDGFLLGVMNPEDGTYYESLTKIALGLGGSSPEGPHLYKINDYYYLMSAEGGTGYEHREVIQRSSSPWGPYEVSPTNPVMSNKDVPDHPFQAIGHADFVQLQDSSWWSVCLGYRPRNGKYHHLGRETFLAPITWSEEGWPKVGTDGIVQQEYPVPNLTEHKWEKEAVRDDFDNDTLRLAWNFIRNPNDEDWSLSENPGYLRLNGSSLNFSEKKSPTFIGRRQPAFDVVASAKISFEPTAENEEAGLVVRANDKNHYDLLITMFAGKKVVTLRKVLQDEIVNQFYKEISNNKVVLRISATDLEYKFWVQEEGHKAELLGSATTQDISTERIGGFTGTYIGMFATGNGAANTNPADFDWFDMEENPTLPYDWSLGDTELLNNMETPNVASISSPAYDQVNVVWIDIDNETHYIIERFDGTKFDSVGITQANDTVFTDTGLEGQIMYIYRIKAKNDEGYSYPSISVSVTTLPKPGPFYGEPLQIPGKIEAEDYDYGEQNEAYYDSDDVNNSGGYRTDGVDIETCSDSGAGFNIGWIDSGEWLTYTVDITDTVADIELRVASENGGSIRLEIDDEQIASTTIEKTGGWQVWKTITIPNVKLAKGENKKLKVTFVSSGFNFNWINFKDVITNSKKEENS